MFRRAVGTSLLAAWFVLSGIVFSESLGFIEEPPDMNGSVEVWLASFGEAIRTSKQTPIAISPAKVVQTGLLWPPPPWTLSFSLLRKEINSLKEAIPIYKLHRVFLV
jgi:hypothetical protein